MKPATRRLTEALRFMGLFFRCGGLSRPQIAAVLWNLRRLHPVHRPGLMLSLASQPQMIPIPRFGQVFVDPPAQSAPSQPSAGSDVFLAGYRARMYGAVRVLCNYESKQQLAVWRAGWDAGDRLLQFAMWPEAWSPPSHGRYEGAARQADRGIA